MERFDDWVTDPRLRRDDVERSLGFGQDDPLLFGEYRAMATGGSTGRRGLFVFDQAEWLTVCSVLLRGIQGTGMTPRFPRARVVSVAAPDATHMTYRFSQAMGNGPFRRLSLSVTDPLADVVERLNAFRPHYLNAYPSFGALLALEQLEGRLRIAPRVVTTSSELCTPEMRERIRAAWGVEPHEVYGRPTACGARRASTATCTSPRTSRSSRSRRSGCSSRACSCGRSRSSATRSPTSCGWTTSRARAGRRSGR